MINRINKRVTNTVKVVKEEPKAAVTEEENNIEEIIEDEVLEEEEVAKVEQKSNNDVKVSTPSTNTKSNNGKSLHCNKKVVTVTKERVIDKIYPRDIYYQNIQKRLSELFSDITLADAEKISKIVEEETLNAASSGATFRYMGGLLSLTEEINPSIRKAPKADYASYTGPSKKITLRKCVIEEGDKYRGDYDKDNHIFVAKEMYNVDTKEWVKIEPIELEV